MKIAILGTKGIPNNYGGYEQFAEYVSKKLLDRGHEVTVYNPSFHPYKEPEFMGVSIIKKFSPEKLIGGAANFIYDFLCLKDALSRKFDIIYEAGYHSVAFSYKLLGVRNRKDVVLITNMDGLEYKRSKWSRFTQHLILYLEKIAVKESPYIISDNLGIQEYYLDRFGRDSFFIPYGADPVTDFNEEILKSYQLCPYEYAILVARLEPENNIETILDGFLLSSPDFPFVVVGNYQTRYGSFLRQKYHSPFIRFVGGIYNKSELDTLRHLAGAYFHGHSVGGTNPSLLEAMASQCFIVGHDNVFNRKVLYDSALYFSSPNDVNNILVNLNKLRATHAEEFIRINMERITSQYNWDKIVLEHEELFRKLSGKQ